MSSTFEPGSPSGASEADQRLRMIEEIMSDEAMPVADRQARLQALAAEWGLPADSAVADAAADPISVQLAEALGMLADGGHKATP